MSHRISLALLLLAASVVCPVSGAASSQSPEALGRLVELIDSDPAAAVEGLDELAAASWPLAPHASYFAAIAQKRVSPEKATERLSKLLAANPDAVFSTAAAAELAELLGAGDTDELSRLADRYVGKDASSVEAARIALAAGTALVASDPRAAARRLSAARQIVPGSEPGKRASRALEELRRSHPELEPDSADDLYAEAVVAGKEGDLAVQQRRLDELLERFPNSTLYDDAVLLRGQVMSRRDGRLAAARWLEQRARGERSPRTRARFLHAAAVHSWNADHSTSALETFAEVLSLATGIAEEQKARYAMGRIHESARRFTAAAAAYRECAHGVDAELATQCEWAAGWVAYRAENFEGAAAAFSAMADGAAKDAKSRTRASGREEALYWQGRSLERAGDGAAAAAAYRALLEEYPDGYYAYLVERRTDLTAKPVTVAALVRDTGPLPDTIAQPLERARLLRQAGIDDLAVAEVVAALERADDATRRAMLPQLVSAGAYSHALRTAFELYRRKVLEENELYPFIYPAAFREIVDREARQNGLDPFLVYSLIRQESLFDERAVSPASAYGLMQLLLPTANRVAAKTNGERVELDDLFQPEVNIKLGTAYLAELGTRFDRDPVLMLAGYNAGERAAGRWRERLRGAELDEFVERISYRETRNYVKKVLRNYRNYRRLYEGPAAEASEAAAENSAASVERVEQAAR